MLHNLEPNLINFTGSCCPCTVGICTHALWMYLFFKAQSANMILFSAHFRDRQFFPQITIAPPFKLNGCSLTGPANLELKKIVWNPVLFLYISIILKCIFVKLVRKVDKQYKSIIKKTFVWRVEISFHCLFKFSFNF